MEKEEIYGIVYGRVQMVMFRDFTTRTARRLGLTGYVRNMPDGSVEVVAQGMHAALERLVAKLRRGSLLSRVDRVDVVWRSPTKTFDSFTLIR